MCIDYTDLYRACPKDAYLFPSIDRLVDRMSEFQVLSFMHAYSGYNQIQMHSLDEEKTTFITKDVNFCYKSCPSALKIQALYTRD